jgi:hypothetical protein
MQQLCKRLDDGELSQDLSRALTDLDDELARYVAWLETAPLA